VGDCEEIPLVGEDGYQCLVGNLEGMEARTFTITAAVDKDTTLSNVQVSEAEVSSTEPERWLPDNTDQAFFWIDSTLVWLPVLIR
jgi:hypothetical protein